MLRVLGLDDEALWLETVKGFSDHDVYHMPQYTKAFRLNGDGEPLFVYYESGEIRAFNIVMKRDIATASPFAGRLPEGQLFDLATPYGYGGFLVEGDRSEAAIMRLNTAYTEYCRDSGVVSEFVRFHPLLSNHIGLEPLYNITEMGKTICVDLSSHDVFTQNINPRTQNRIRKAQRECLGVGCGNSPEVYAQFADMYTETMTRAGAQPYYFFSPDFFQCVCDELVDNASVFYAVCHNRIVAMELVLFCNGKMHSHLQASLRDCQHLSPVPLLLYSESLWGMGNGISRFHLGGGLGSAEDNIYLFKSNFNKKSDTRFYTGRRIFDQGKYDDLLRLRLEASPDALRSGFFPEYRA
jgi:hypothetical protein